MRTETITIYKFSELSPESQGKAIENYREFYSSSDWDLIVDEIRDTLHAAEKMIGFSTDYSWDMWSVHRVRVTYKYEDCNHTVEEFITKWDLLLSGDCPFTGCCYDENFLDAMRGDWKDYDTVEQLLESCATSLFLAGIKGIECQQLGEAIMEAIEANDTEFYKDGGLV